MPTTIQTLGCLIAPDRVPRLLPLATGEVIEYDDLGVLCVTDFSTCRIVTGVRGGININDLAAENRGRCRKNSVTLWCISQ